MERHTLIHTHARATDAQGPAEHTTRGDVGGRRLDDMPSQCCHLPASSTSELDEKKLYIYFGEIL
ncbi:hypothetical protein T10_5344 [Trichinella papuae]|uniref:Uncharacterized protein n=1 Tax=Trichinella papuae TaxID=268474 RepID=A0A0V1MT99_9BILA|nr:hypothetical protein T10_5344 [Trichinella papuae]